MARHWIITGSMTITSQRLDAAYGQCEARVRTEDRDRWLSLLFAPADLRPHLHALFAFSLEIASVRDRVSDALPGEVRFQWWREAIEGTGRGDVEAHPLAAALLDTIGRFGLPRGPFVALIEARCFDLYDDPMPSQKDLEGYCGETCSALIRLASIVLARGRDPGGSDCAGHAGVAYAITGLLRAFVWTCARGQIYVPGDLIARHGLTVQAVLRGPATSEVRAALAETRALARRHLEETRRLIGAVSPEAGVAFLPVCLVEHYLGLMERPAYDPYLTRIELPQWRRQWIMWTNARRAARRASDWRAIE
jgi:phytoene synthase